MVLKTINMSRFIHAHEQIREYTVKSSIKDSKILDMHCQPVFIEPSKYCNWWEHEIKRGFIVAFAIGHWILVDWKWMGNKSVLTLLS